jgi:hypothetical protein
MKTILSIVVSTTFLFASCSKEEATEDYNYNNYNSGGGGSSGCPTTAACGCSGKTKSECEASPCCKWTVGQGCGCR